MLYVHCMSSFSNHCCNMTPQPNSNITHLKILGPVDKVICHSLPICSVTQQSTHFVKSSHKLGQDNFSHLYPASWNYQCFLFTNKCTSDCLKNNIKIYIKIAPTCFGAVTPSSVSALMQHTHQQGPTNICSHITELITHWCTIIDYFNKCNFSKHELMRSLRLVWLHQNMLELF